MDFELSETMKEVRDSARAFAERLKPQVAAWDEEEALPSEILREAGRLGFFGLMTAEEYGGMGLDAPCYVAAMEELARASASLQGCLSVHNSLACAAVSRFGTPEQKSRYLPRLAAGELIGAYSLSEPGAGSDAGSIATFAAPAMKDADGKPVLGAHPNSRFTAPAGQCPTISPNWEKPEGVPISALIFGGRRERLAPLVMESLDWNHGVYLGATVASEMTAAAMGGVGQVRRDPMAMLPFCGYHMGDYFAHWIAMGAKIPRPPKIFHVNWFRKGADGKFLWPGYGENLRVLEWVLARTRGEGKALKTPIGWLPTKDGLDLSGLGLPAGTLEKLLEVKNEEWTGELDGVKEFFAKFGSRLPQELWRQFEALKERLKDKVSA